ncbi:hypothetical protein BU15DRAFT_59953 [Melanogaster broomeanus]|nr:hypothetical protein BU15DRAFT_59953 [Melanogaster broomeanus]
MSDLSCNSSPEPPRGRRSQQDADHGDQDDQSLYNDGKGIQFSVQFTPLPPPVKAGEKRRKNAKAKPINALMYIHEENSFMNFITLCLTKFKRVELPAALHGGRLVNTPLDMKYTIPHTPLHDIELQSKEDFAEMIEQVTNTAKAAVKVFIDEIKLETEDNDEDDDDEATIVASAAAKKKKETLPEELEQAELIDQLSILYKCEDRSCKFNICWVSEAGQHLHLTHQHLRAWAAAIQDATNDSNLETPPNMKMFDPPSSRNSDNSADATILAKRHLTTNHNSSTSSPQVVVNFDGLAEILSGLHGNGQHTSTGSSRGPGPNHTLTPTNNPATRRALPPKISLEEFCLRYALSQAIHTKLTKLAITGPHALRFVSNDVLMNDGTFAVGELADVRDAEQRWAQDGFH